MQQTFFLFRDYRSQDVGHVQYWNKAGTAVGRQNSTSRWLYCFVGVCKSVECFGRSSSSGWFLRILIVFFEVFCVFLIFSLQKMIAYNFVYLIQKIQISVVKFDFFSVMSRNLNILLIIFVI
jgi:hypothetical protein